VTVEIANSNSDRRNPSQLE